MQKFKEKRTKEVYSEYCLKCSEHGFTPLSKEAFSKKFLKENPEYLVKVKKINGKSERVYYCVGIKKYPPDVSSLLWD